MSCWAMVLPMRLRLHHVSPPRVLKDISQVVAMCPPWFCDVIKRDGEKILYNDFLLLGPTKSDSSPGQKKSQYLTTSFVSPYSHVSLQPSVPSHHIQTDNYSHVSLQPSIPSHLIETDKGKQYRVSDPAFHDLMIQTSVVNYRSILSGTQAKLEILPASAFSSRPWYSVKNALPRSSQDQELHAPRSTIKSNRPPSTQNLGDYP